MTVSNRNEAPAVAADDKIDPQTRKVLAVLVLGGMAAIMDTTIVTIALHDLVLDLHTGVNTIQWVTTAYLLALTASIPITGWAEAHLGGKRLWIVALTLFLVGSTLCAISWNPLSLIAFRVFQGLGAGLLMTLMQTLAMRAAGGHASARVTAAISLPIALGPIIGPVLGGMLLTWADWRWIFLINVPLCLLGIVTAWKVLPADRTAGSQARPPLDLVGLLLLAPGLALLLFGLSRCGHSGSATVTVDTIVAGVVLVLGFALWALRRRDRALIAISLLARRSVGSASLMMFLTGVTLYGAMFLLPLYWQLLRGESALGAALLLIPQGVGSLLTRLFIGKLTERFGAPLVCMVAFAMTVVGTVPFALADGSTHTWLLGTALLVRGIGMGAVMVPIISSAYVGLEPSAIAHASMQTRIMQQVGGAFGTAIGAMLLQTLASAAHPEHAFQGAFWVFTALGAGAAAASFLLPTPDRSALKP